VPQEVGLSSTVPGDLNTSNACVCFSAEALAGQVTQVDFDQGMIYPPFSNIRKISAHIAAHVAAKAYDLR